MLHLSNLLILSFIFFTTRNTRDKKKLRTMNLRYEIRNPVSKRVLSNSVTNLQKTRQNLVGNEF